MIIGRIKTSRVFLDGNLLLGMDTECALDRKLIAKEGCVSIVVDTEHENFRCEVAVVGISNTLEDGSSLQKGIINTVKKYFQGPRKDLHNSEEDTEQEDAIMEKKDDQTIIDELSEMVEKKIWGVAKKRPLLTIQFWGRALAIVRNTPEAIEGEAEATQSEYDGGARSERRPYADRSERRSSSFGGGDRGNSGFARREDGDRPRSFGPRRDGGSRGGSSFGGSRRPSFGGPRREPREGGDRPRSFGPRREEGERSPRPDYGDRPARSFAPREGGSSFRDRAPRSDRPFTPRAPREDRGEERAPRREFGDRTERRERPERPAGGDRPRSFAPRSGGFDDRGPRREPREGGDDRPRREFSDRADRSAT